MKHRMRILIACVMFILLAMSSRVALAKDVSGNTNKPKAVVANKTYTQKFEKKGDVDCFKFTSGGGKYKLIIWDLSGRNINYYGEVTQYGSDWYVFFADWDKGLEYNYGEYSTFSAAGGDKARYQVGGYMTGSFSPNVNETTGTPIMQMTTDIGKHKKGKEVAVWFKGDYKGKYKFKIVGKKAPAAKKTTTAKKKVTKLTKSNTRIIVKDATYTGKPLKPKVTVKYGSKTLKKGTHFTLSYAKNTKVGKATVTITGKGSYKGSVKASFQVKPRL